MKPRTTNRLYTKRFWALFLCLALLLTLAVGCGNSTAAESAPQEPSAEAADSAAPEAEPPVEPAEVEAAASAEEASAEEAAAPAEKEKVYLIQFPVDDDFTITVSESTHPLLMSSGSVDPDGTGMGWVTWLEARTGVDLVLDLYSIMEATDKQNLMIASGDYKDIIVGSLNYPGGVDGAVEEEVLVDLFDYTDYMPDYMEALYADAGYVASALSTEKHLTSFYGITDANTMSDYGPVIRQDWLDAQGLDKPETYDELHNVLTVFKEQYGATMWISSYGGVPGDFSGGYGVMEYCGGAGFPVWVEDDGTFTFPTRHAEFKDYVTMLHSWYEEKLIYPDFISQGGLQYPSNDIISDGTLGVWYSFAAVLSTQQSVLEAADSSADIEPFTWPLVEAGVGTDYPTLGKASSSSGVDGQGAFSVTTASEDVELVCAVFNEFYTDEGSNFCNWGIEGETYVVDETGKKSYTELVTNDDLSLGTEAMMARYFFKDGPYRYDYTKYLTSYGERELTACDLWTCENSQMTMTMMTSEESTEYNNIKADLLTVYQENLAKFITGDRNIETEWDSFVADMETVGLDDLLAIGQVGADNYQARLDEAQEMIDAYYAS